MAVQFNLSIATVTLMPNHFSISNQDYNIYTACIFQFF